jgi:hypothetical protein
LYNPLLGSNETPYLTGYLQVAGIPTRKYVPAAYPTPCKPQDHFLTFNLAMESKKCSALYGTIPVKVMITESSHEINQQDNALSQE